MPHLDVDGGRVSYAQGGSGPDVVLLHGAVTDRRSWDEITALLSERFRVTAWDAPGCGGSADPDDSWGMDGFADSLVGLVRVLGLRRPHLVGHSWGSTLALSAHLRHPEAVGSLALAGAYAGWAGSLPAEDVAGRLTFALGVCAQLEAGGWDPTSMPGLFSERISPERAVRLAETMLAIRAPGTRVMAQALAACDLRPQLSSVTAATLVVAGGADERSSPQVGQTIVDAIPGADLAVLPDAGHEMFLEEPAAFVGLVTDFLGRVATSGR